MYECECGGKYNEVVDSRKSPHGRTRRRVCDRCRKRLVTIEIEMSEYKALRIQRKGLVENLRRLLNEERLDIKILIAKLQRCLDGCTDIITYERLEELIEELKHEEE